MEVRARLDYTQIREIGKGHSGNSVVFEIEDPQLDGRLAAKEMDRGELAPQEYFREPRILYASKHENIVPVQYACATVDRITLVMPLYRRGNLSERIKRGPLPQREAIRIAIAILAALGHVHSKNFIHFDVKPSNVLFSDADAPLLSDFGQARSPGPMGTRVIPGMEARLHAPENCELGTGSIHTDIYQVGLLLYRMVNGEPFWNAQWPDESRWDETRAGILRGRLPRRDRFQPHVHRHLQTLIRRALAVDPSARFHSAFDFRRALGRLQIPIDWTTAEEPNGRTEWRAQRAEQPDLVVELEAAPDKTWGVDVFTDHRSDGGRRARNPSAFRQTKLSRTKADGHLKSVFRKLGSPGVRSTNATPSAGPATPRRVEP